MTKIKVAFVHHSLKRGGGSEKVIHDLIRGLDRSRFEPVLCCLYDPGELGDDLAGRGCRIYHNLISSPRDPRSIWRVRKVLQEEQIDLMYVTDGFLNMIVGRLAAFLARTPVSVLAFHSYDTIIRQGTKPLRRAALEVSDVIYHPSMHAYIALAESHKSYLIEKKRLRASKISVIYNGVDIGAYGQPIGTEAARHALGIPAGAAVVSIVAGLRRWKDHEMLLNAAGPILEEVPNAHFLIAGDGPERHRLESRARHLGIEARIRFMGVVADIPGLLAATDVVVLTSKHEAFPLSLLEAMAAGLPVVATDVGSVAEIVVEGDTGYIVPSGDPRGFASRVSQVLTDPALAARLGAAGRERVATVFTIERMVERTQELFTDLVMAKPRGGR